MKITSMRWEPDHAWPKANGIARLWILPTSMKSLLLADFLWNIRQRNIQHVRKELPIERSISTLLVDNFPRDDSPYLLLKSLLASCCRHAVQWHINNSCHATWKISRTIVIDTKLSESGESHFLIQTICKSTAPQVLFSDVQQTLCTTNLPERSWMNQQLNWLMRTQDQQYVTLNQQKLVGTTEPYWNILVCTSWLGLATISNHFVYLFVYSSM